MKLLRQFKSRIIWMWKELYSWLAYSGAVVEYEIVFVVAIVFATVILKLLQ